MITFNVSNNFGAVRLWHDIGLSLKRVHNSQLKLVQISDIYTVFLYFSDYTTETHNKLFFDFFSCQNNIVYPAII